MIVRLRDGVLVVTPQEGETLAGWLDAHAGQVFRLRAIAGGSAQLQALGPEPDACRVPINVTSRTPEPLRLVSNFAHTPFRLDGFGYESIEGFWQGLKFPDAADRRRLAELWGPALVSTHNRPLVHQVKPDSKNIPGVIMAAIWMRIRDRLDRTGAEEAPTA
jgi:hypothetical protein